MQVSHNKITKEKVPNLLPTHYIDARIYTDPTILEEERVKIFSNVWNLVCHESEIPNPGSFRTATVAGYPCWLSARTIEASRPFIISADTVKLRLSERVVERQKSFSVSTISGLME